jgi:hypothetical protein
VAKSDWDIDFRYGQQGEQMVKDLLSIETVEVKRDRRWKETGNLFIETSCFYVNEGVIKRSGLLVTKATHWAFVLEDLTLIVSREDLFATLMQYGRKVECNIEPNVSTGYLITVAQLLQWQVDKANEVQNANI